MLGQNSFTRVALMLMICSLLHSINPRVRAGEAFQADELKCLIYPRGEEVQQYMTEFNFQRRIIAVVYTSDTPAMIETYYQQKMPNWGWTEDVSPEKGLFNEELGSDAIAIAFKKDDWCCSITALAGITLDAEGTLISIEVTEEPEELQESASLDRIAKELAPIPIFPGSSNAVIMKTDLTGAGATVSFETSFGVKHVADFYRKNMTRLGYTESSPLYGLIVNEEFDTRYYSKEDQTIIIGIHQLDNGMTSILIMIQDEEELACSILDDQEWLGMSA